MYVLSTKHQRRSCTQRLPSPNVAQEPTMHKPIPIQSSVSPKTTTTRSGRSLRLQIWIDSCLNTPGGYVEMGACIHPRGDEGGGCAQSESVPPRTAGSPVVVSACRPLARPLGSARMRIGCACSVVRTPPGWVRGERERHVQACPPQQ